VPTKTISRCRELRRHSTSAEALLWFHLRDRRLAGFKFRRQFPCGPFILDFYCMQSRLAIELDGGQHFEPDQQKYDARRTRFLHQRGINVLRFATDLVFRETNNILEEILRAVDRNR
jgi:very-short-patch-repair endonuclease